MIFFLNYITPENMYFNTRNIAGVLKVNGLIQGTVSVIFYKQKKCYYSPRNAVC